MLNQAIEVRDNASGVSAGFGCETIPPSVPVPGLLDDVHRGMLEPPRSLPPKYFYDAHGSELFDRICNTPEYYPTRIESVLLRQGAEQILDLVRPEYLIELGSGTSRKTRQLFDVCPALDLTPRYWPMDVCRPMLLDAGEALIREYPWLSVNALVGDYHGGFGHFPRVPGRALYMFLGGTVGNFGQDEAVALLGEVRGLMRDDDHILIGVDRVKDIQTLEAAYNDADGVTAKFNLNVLRVLNDGVQADFDLGCFHHRAVYNRRDRQIEMYLVADSPQTVHIGALGRTLEIGQGEHILTEISRKFTYSAISRLLSDAGLMPVHHRQAEGGYYSLVLARPAR